MANFEQVGRRLDRELKKLRRYLEDEVKPATARKAAAALRKASAGLSEAARQLEARGTKKKK